MASQLWQRLRAARKFADLTQANLAAACGITRSGYAFFEASDPNSRTRPNTDQIMAIARLTRVPIEWLLNDNVDPGEVWKIGVVASGSAPPPAFVAPAPAPVVLPSPAQAPDRLEDTFWRAVEYHVVSQDPSRVTAFDAMTHPEPLPLHVRYFHGTTLACFTSRTEPSSLALFMGRLLLHERAMGRSFRKHLLVWSRGGPGPDLDGTLEVAEKVFAITIRVVHTPDEAAAYLLSQK